MADLIGSLKDFKPQAVGNNAEVIFTPWGPAISAGKSLLVPKEIRVSPASDGTFTVSLSSWAGTNPSTAYRVRVEWTPTGMPYPVSEEIPWPLVVTGDGQLTDMFADVQPGKLITKGDKGDDGGVIMQAELDAIEARLPAVGNAGAFEVVDLDDKILLGTTDDGGTIVSNMVIYPSEGLTIETEDGYVLFDAEDPAAGPATAPSPGTTAATIDTLHAFLFIGQSNMSGRGLPCGPAYGDIPDPRILQYGSTRSTLEPATVPLDMHDTATGISPATTFSRNYLKTQPPNVAVLEIPAAHGGTGFTTAPDTLTWTPNAASSPAYDLPALAVAQTLAAIETARAAGYAVILQGILWHQGENNSGTSQSAYAALLDSLISYLRSALGSSKLAFVVGQMSPEGIDLSTGRQGVDRAHSGTPARVAYTGFAPAMRGGTNIGDTTHFSRTGVEYLGKTYLAGYWQALGNTLTAPPAPPVNVTATKTGTAVTVTWAAPPATLAKDETFDLTTASTRYTWTAAPSHATGYRVETKTGAGAWTAAARSWEMALAETVTVPAGSTQVRVTALNGAAESAPVTVTAIGA